MREIFGERLKTARKAKGLTIASLADIMSVGQNTISRWETGTRAPDFETVRNLSRCLDTSVAYLLGETDNPRPVLRLDGKMKLDGSAVIGKGANPPAPNSNARIIPQEKLMWIPVISPEVKLCAGNGIDYSDSGLEWTVVEHIPIADGRLAALYSEDSLLAMYVEGDSMEPQIHDGDLVVFNRDPNWVSGNIMVVCLDGRLMVKGVISTGQGKPPVLRSTNPEYKDITITEDSFFLIYGRVLKISTERAPKPII